MVAARGGDLVHGDGVTHGGLFLGWTTKIVIEADKDRTESTKLVRTNLGHDVVELLLTEVGGEPLDSVDKVVAPSPAI